MKYRYGLILLLLPMCVVAEDFFQGMPGKPILAGCSGKVIQFAADGSVAWEYTKNVGNMGDTQLLPNGNILFADADAVEEFNANQEVVFRFVPEDKRGDSVFSAERLADGNTLVGWNTQNKLLIVSPEGTVLKTIPCQFLDKINSHSNMRMVRATKAGTYLVAHKSKGVIAEYNDAGEVLHTFSVPNHEVYGVLELADGSVLGSFLDCLVQFDREGKEIWRCSKDELSIPISYMCSLYIRPNGNIVVGNYAANRGESHAACMFEVTRDKKIVWSYQNPKAPGSFMSVTVLD